MRQVRWVVAGVVVAGAACLGGYAQAQAEKPFTPGEVFIEMHGNIVQVRGCRGTGPTVQCQFRVLKESNDPITYGDIWWDTATQRNSERLWIRNGNAPYAGPSVPLPSVGVPPAAARAAGNANIAQAPAAVATGQCNKTPYGGPVSGATAASPDLFRRKIADTYTMETRAPYWYGVTFESFTVGPVIVNTVSNVPGVGATRVSNGAPPNAKLWPVSSKHVVCEQSPGQAARRRVESRYYCFVSKDNEWSCGGEGVPKITQIR